MITIGPHHVEEESDQGLREGMNLPAVYLPAVQETNPTPKLRAS